MAPSGKKLLQKLRVPLGFVFAAAFLIFAKPSWLSIAFGGGIGLFGLALRAWSAGHIRKGTEITQSGPYRFTRNPLYLGSFVMGLGLMAASGVWWIVLVFAVLFLSIYIPVMSVEAEELSSVFGEEFVEYAKKVPLFLPGFGVAAKSDKKFERVLYMRYREYQACLGYFSILGVLVLKTLYF